MAINQRIRLEYLRNKVESASPIGRIIILCEACLKFLFCAKEALVRGDKIVFVENNIKAQNIIREFRNSLNLEVDEKIASGFYGLYNFMLKQLRQSIQLKKVEPLDKVHAMITQLCSSWKTAEEKGLGKDIKPAEIRRGLREGSKMRTIAPAQSYAAMNEGLNFIS
ncbi:MAG: flagellar export chaperone FliS [Candidatus Omnitrophica bacterium]|nr:flagellar export chaperone FliS [Candidatus Omnitrophota bacterium]